MRRLLAEGISVELSVKTANRTTAEKIAENLTEEAINQALTTAGPPAATVTQKPFVVLDTAAEAFLNQSPERSGRRRQAYVLLAQDFVDCFLDWVSWLGASGAGDLEFSNDPNGIISNLLIAIGILGIIFFFLDLLCYVLIFRYETDSLSCMPRWCENADSRQWAATNS